MEGNNFHQSTMNGDNTSVVTVSPFDYSVENHFNAMNTIHKLCTSTSSEEAITEIELQQLSSRITFLREWNYFSYNPKTVRFSCDVEGRQGRDVLGEVTLPQFSAANVPKTEGLSTESGKTGDDFVLYVGGHVWALDWCPSIHQGSDSHVNCEFLAVSAHPPESSYHKIGAPLTGRGVIQIWCVVHAAKEEESPAVLKVQRNKNKQAVEKSDTFPLKKRRGRPRKESDDSQPLKKARAEPKKQTDKQRSLVDMNRSNESVPPLAIDSGLVLSPSLTFETTMSMDKHALVKSSDIDLGLGGSNRENQIDQTTYSQFDNGEDKKLLINEKARGKPKKGRGRPKKKEDIKESLDTMDIEKGSVRSVAIDKSLVSSEFVVLTDVTTGPDEHAPLLGHDSNVVDSNNDRQVLQETAIPLYIGNDKKKLKTTKAKGKGRPKKNVKESLVAFCTEDKSVLALTEATRCMEGPIDSKSYNGHVGSYDSNFESQVGQTTPTEVLNTREKKPLPLKKTRQGAKKKKDMNESLVDFGTEEGSFPPTPVTDSSLCYVEDDVLLESESRRGRRMRKQKCMKDFVVYSENVPVATEDSQVSSDIPTPLEGTWSREACVSLQSSDTDFGFETETLDSYRRRKKKKMKDKIKAGSHADGIPPLVDHYKDRDSSAVLQYNNDSLQDVITPIQEKNGSLKVCTGSFDPPTDVALDHYKDRDSSVVLQNNNDSLEDVITPIQAKNRSLEVNSGRFDPPTDVALYHYKDRDPSLVLQNNNDNLQDVITPIQAKHGSLEVRTVSFDPPTDVAFNHNKDRDPSPVLQINNDSLQDVIRPIQAKNGSLEVSTGSFVLPTDVALPRVVICLAHNGKVAWDVKWRPPSVPDAMHKNYIGHLAVVLGNGSVEVWEVPSPRAIEVLYSSCKKESTDPRFLKLEPLFRCSKLMSGNRHSIPLTVEWSTSSPHDLLLAGCHDGTVALWKFTSSGLSQDARPLLCFSADTYPIRALAWAPDGSDEESANTVVTAGHGGVRFWDIRDPYRPLGEPHTVRRFIYSLDWLQNPRCIMMAFDDGTLRCLSLSKAAYDVPVTGKPFLGTQQQGLHTYFCSSSPIWSVQTSRLTGQVVYCSADGSALHFQLTSKAVDKDSSRYRAPHFLCGTLIEEDAALTVNTPLPNIPFPLKKSQNELGDFRSVNALMSDLNQAKSANDQPNIPALCYHNDPSEFGDGERSFASKAKTKSMTSKKKNCDPDSVPVDNLEKGENQEVRNEIEVLPPKIVAMHRVRWNHNKGSERWVCYGGAAGIVRCQEIFP